MRPVNKKFSVGLTYYEIIDFGENQLATFLGYTPREEIIDWLQWNDPNGTYNDKDSLREFENIVSKEEGTELIKRQILQQ